MQPKGILNIYDTLAEQYINGFDRTVKWSQFPIIANKKRLLPFQFNIHYTGGTITEFKLIDNNGNETDLISDVAKIVNYDFSTYEQFIYDVQADLITTITDGYYYIHLKIDSSYKYSDPFMIGDAELSYFGFGEYSYEYSYEYNKQSLNAKTDNNYILNISNVKDFEDKIYQFNYQDILILSALHGATNVFKGGNTELIISNDTGKEIIREIKYFEKWEFSFMYNKNSTKFISKLNLMDSAILILDENTEITLQEFEVLVEGLPTDIFKKTTIKYKTNFEHNFLI